MMPARLKGHIGPEYKVLQSRSATASGFAGCELGFTGCRGPSPGMPDTGRERSDARSTEVARKILLKHATGTADARRMDGQTGARRRPLWPPEAHARRRPSGSARFPEISSNRIELGVIGNYHSGHGAPHRERRMREMCTGGCQPIGCAGSAADINADQERDDPTRCFTRC